MYVFEPMESIDVDGDCRCVGVQEFLFNTEHELVIPGRILVAVGVDSG